MGINKKEGIRSKSIADRRFDAGEGSLTHVNLPQGLHRAQRKSDFCKHLYCNQEKVKLHCFYMHYIIFLGKDFVTE